MIAYRTGLEWKCSFNQDGKQIFLPELEDKKKYILKKIEKKGDKLVYIFEELFHI